jgi:hypothetical protein
MRDQEPVKHTPATPNVALAVAATILTALLRFVPWPFRPPNFAAVGALSLYSGARLPWWISPFIPLGVMYVTDAIMWHGFLWSPFNYYVYGCYFVTALVGMLLRHTESPWKLGAAVIGTSLVFFVVTNFGVWFGAHGDLTAGKCYADSWDGLIACYIAALPFYQWTVISDIAFSMVFFGAHGWLTRTAPQNANAFAPR